MLYICYRDRKLTTTAQRHTTCPPMFRFVNYSYVLDIITLRTEEHARAEIRATDKRQLRSYCQFQITITGMYCMPGRLVMKCKFYKIKSIYYMAFYY